ncbi:MAG: zinc-ribbon domain-containing protein [Desulfovibrio sp.]|nr:zinc-ribbon domain-containing protein [Desulfovibrio sp.]
MNITCPQCGFSRQLPPERIPDKAVMATCPKCSCRFRFMPPAVTPQTAPCSDPLPPGAIIPGQCEDQPAAIQNGSSVSQPTQDEEDIRQTASRAYSREATRLEEEPEAMQPVPDDEEQEDYSSPCPWATAPGRDGWLNAFYQTVLLVLFAAPRFFTGLDPRTPQLRALSFFLIICVIQIITEYFWMGQVMDFLQTEAAGDPDLQSLTELFSERDGLLLVLLFQTGVQVMKLYAFSGLLYLAYRFIAPKRTSFPLLLQIMAYSAAPALLCVIPLLGSVAGMIWSLACLLVGCRAAMGLSWQQTLTGFLPLFLVVSSMILQAVGGFGGF